MALNERCPSAWHMLIERLILLYYIYNVVYNSIYRFILYQKFFGIFIKSGEQVSIRLSAYLKEENEILHIKKG